MRYRVLPYRQGSRSAKALAEALGGKVLKLEGSSYLWKEGDVLINWGNTKEGGGYASIPLNPALKIRGATNKLLFFQAMKENHADLIPEFWTSVDDIPDGAFPVVCRTTLAGHSGDGIVIAGDRSGLVPAPLYVRYVKKKEEYRIHVGVKGSPDETSACHVIAAQRKARRSDVPNDEVNWQVRNHANGFIYKRQGVSPPQSVIDAACYALRVTGLDFGAVDVIWNAQQEKAYVLEINTAPGLEGQTVDDYKTFFMGQAQD